MHIQFSPQLRAERLNLSVVGDVLTINDATLDFTPLPEGGVLPVDAVDSPWVADDVTRVGGVLHLTLILPHGENAPMETRFPVPVTVTSDGPVTMPAYEVTP